MSDIRAYLTARDARLDAQDEQQRSPRATRRRAEAIVEITAHARFSHNAPTKVAFIACLYGGERVTGPVVDIQDSRSFRIQTTDGPRVVEIEDVEHSGTCNLPGADA
jgi:hypothetical protein